MEIRITTLSENTACGGYIAEWGLSMLVETDGMKILFVSTLRDNHDVWCLAADAQRLVRLTTHHGFDGEPCWSPAGDRIAFVSTVDGHRNVWVMKSDGSEKRQLTQGSGDCRDPDW